jgi:hypothetical protein
MAHSSPNPLAFENLSDPDLPEWRKCSAFAQAILEAIVQATPDFLIPRIEKLFCFDLVLSSLNPVESRACVLSIPTSPSDNLHNCLQAFFHGNDTIEPRPAITRWIREWPTFLFIHLDRDMGTPLNSTADCRPFYFQHTLNMTPYGWNSGNRARKANYQLVGCISYIADAHTLESHYVTMLAIFGEWIRFEERQLRSMLDIEECDDRSDDAGSCQLATMLLCYKGR